ncbi:MAG: hypothetical protein HFG34_08645 [Eubacterium sp.]|nr:hypothetical protein [Eubacterium sp.]
MRKELPVTTEPWVKTYSYYALPMCVIMADERIGKRVAEYEILNGSGSEWKSIHMKRGEGDSWCYESKDDISLRIKPSISQSFPSWKIFRL